MKQKDFARNVNRDDIKHGAADFGVDLTEHIQFEMETMKGPSPPSWGWSAGRAAMTE